MARFPLVLGLLTLVACGGDLQGQDALVPGPDGTPAGETPATEQPTGEEATMAARLSGSVTDAEGSQNARLAGPGTLAATATVQVTDTAGNVLGSARVESGLYTVGLAEFPTDTLLFVEALDGSGSLLGSVVVEITGTTEIEASPLTVESSVEAAVFAELLADGAPLGIWAEVRNRVDVPVALAVAAEADEFLAVDNLALAVDASWQTHVDAWTAAGVSVDTMSALWFDASTELSAGLAAGESDAYAAFEAALVDAALAQGLTLEAVDQADVIAHASVRAALTASAASTAVTLEAFRATALTESATLQATVNTQVLAMQADGSSTVAAIETSFQELQAAIQAATSPAEIEAAVQAWRDAVLDILQQEITSQMDFLDQLLAALTAALADLELALGDLETALQGVIEAATGVLDAGALAGDIGTAFAQLEADVATEFADLDPEDADAMTSVSLAFPGL